MPDSRQEPWHLNKSVPIATIAVLLGQLVLGVMWITTLSNRVDSMAEGYGRRINVMEAAQSTANAQTNIFAVQLGRQEEAIAGVRSDINRLIAAIERERSSR